MFFTKFLELCDELGVSPSRVCLNLGLSKASAYKWRNGSIPSGETLQKIADYFGVSVDYLLNGEETKKDPSKTAEVSDDVVKVALFGGDGEVTPEMWEEVRRFAEYVKIREKNRKDGGSF